MNPLHDSESFFYFRCDTMGGIIDCNKAFRTSFPGVNKYKHIVHPDDIKLIPEKNSCQANRFRPLDVTVRIKIADEYFKSVWHLSSVDSLLYTCIGTAFTQRTLSDDQKMQQIRAFQSHQVRAPLASLMGLIGLLDRESMKDEHQKIFLMMDKQIAEYDKIIRDITNQAL